MRLEKYTFGIIIFSAAAVVITTALLPSVPGKTPEQTVRVAPAPATTVFRIGVVADIHGQTGKRFNYEWMEPETVMEPLIRFTSYMNDVFHPDIVVSVGDLIEGSNRAGAKSVTDFRFLASALAKANVPVLHVIGNHDRRGLVDDAQWESLTGSTATYSYRDEGDMRIVTLDYDDAGKDETDDDTIPLRPSNGKFLISEPQFSWLDKTLSEASGKRLVIFTHVPISESAIGPGNLFNPPEQRARLRNMFADYDVSAVVAGHVEMLRYEEDRGVRYFSFPGFYRSGANEKPVVWYGSYAALTLSDTASAIFRYQKTLGGTYSEVIIPSSDFDALTK
jgi:3',5'-cyclic AMP phosphodiesterase CpdA